MARLPVPLKVLLEYLLRSEDGQSVSGEDIEAIAGWDPAEPASIEIAFTPSRVLVQDFTGVPAIVDLAANARSDGRTIETMRMTQPDL